MLIPEKNNVGAILTEGEGALQPVQQETSAVVHRPISVSQKGDKCSVKNQQTNHYSHCTVNQYMYNLPKGELKFLIKSIISEFVEIGAINLNTNMLCEQKSFTT